MSKIIHAYGLLASPLQVSETLAQLRVGHTLVNDTLRAKGIEHHFSTRQPAWPIVLPTIQALGRYQCNRGDQILLICDSLALLSTCNVGILKPEDMETSLRKALNYAVANPMLNWKLTRIEPTIGDYVANATTPSYLNLIQAEFYKITPYDLRKEIQALVIGCLAGIESRSKLFAKLSTSYKLDNLKTLVKDPKFGALKDAVSMFRSNGNVELTATTTGYQTFELLYVTRSSAKTQKDLVDKKKK